MASPRERSRQTRRRIAGERTRPPADGPAAAPPSAPAPPSPTSVPEEGQTGEGQPGERLTTATPASRTAETAEPAETTEPTEPAEATEAEEPTREQTADEAGEQPSAVAPRGTGRRFSLPWLGTGDDAGPGPANWVLAVLAGLLVAALALDGFVVFREVSNRQAEEDAARAMHSAVVEAPSVAEKAAPALLGYRYDRLPQDLAQARQYLTDDYAPKYISAIRRLVASSAKDLRVTVRANVLASGVSEASPERADVLLFVNQTTIAPSEAPKTALNRVVFQMVPRDGGWKVDEIKAF